MAYCEEAGRGLWMWRVALGMGAPETKNEKEMVKSQGYVVTVSSADKDFVLL